MLSLNIIQFYENIVYHTDERYCRLMIRNPLASKLISKCETWWKISRLALRRWLSIIFTLNTNFSKFLARLFLWNLYIFIRKYLIKIFCFFLGCGYLQYPIIKKKWTSRLLHCPGSKFFFKYCCFLYTEQNAPIGFIYTVVWCISVLNPLSWV